MWWIVLIIVAIIGIGYYVWKKKSTGWSDWTPWTICNIGGSCGQGKQTRNKTCKRSGDIVSPNFCEGEIPLETKDCERECPWSDTTDCSVNCGGGTKKQEQCLSSPNCSKKNTREVACNTHSCEHLPGLDKYFTEMSSLPCSKQCSNEATKIHSYICNKPTELGDCYDGDKTVKLGETYEKQIPCFECRDYGWENDEGKCSTKCGEGDGEYVITQTCVNPINGMCYDESGLPTTSPKIKSLGLCNMGPCIKGIGFSEMVTISLGKRDPISNLIIYEDHEMLVDDILRVVNREQLESGPACLPEDGQREGLVKYYQKCTHPPEGEESCWNNDDIKIQKEEVDNIKFVPCTMSDAGYLLWLDTHQYTEPIEP